MLMPPRCFPTRKRQSMQQGLVPMQRIKSNAVNAHDYPVYTPIPSHIAFSLSRSLPSQRLIRRTKAVSDDYPSHNHSE